jgi:V8-like Glu-specific endopeptidase
MPTKRSTTKTSKRVVKGLRRQPVASSTRAMEEADESLLPSPAPTPARYYQIRKGDTLLGVAGKAYGVKAGAARLEFARRVNRHPLNRKYLRKQKANNLFPEGQLSFLPEFSCDVNEQIAAIQTAVSGKCFAVLWIPDAAEIKHPFLGKALDIPGGLLAELLKQRSPDEMDEDESIPTKSRMASSSKPRSLESDALSIVADTSVAPFRFICSVMAIFKRKDTVFLVGPASGTLIGERHVLTAAHVIYSEDNGLPFENPMLIVTPGDDSSFKNSAPPSDVNDLPQGVLSAFILGKSPLGNFVALSAAFPKEHKKPTKEIIESQTHHLFDYAVITLPESTGKLKRKRRRFGYWGATSGEGTRFQTQAKRDDVKGKTVCVAGYPTNEERIAQSGITQWLGEGPVDNDNLSERTARRKSGRERLGYTILTEEGHSGAPVWRKVSSGKQVFFDLLAVHSEGGDKLLFSASGVLLTTKVVENINAWMQQT